MSGTQEPLVGPSSVDGPVVGDEEEMTWGHCQVADATQNHRHRRPGPPANPHSGSFSSLSSGFLYCTFSQSKCHPG